MIIAILKIIVLYLLNGIFIVNLMRTVDDTIERSILNVLKWPLILYRYIRNTFYWY